MPFGRAARARTASCAERLARFVRPRADSRGRTKSFKPLCQKRQYEKDQEEDQESQTGSDPIKPPGPHLDGRRRDAPSRPRDSAVTGSIGGNNEEIPGRHQEIADVGRDGEDVREGKGRRTSASVSSEVGVVAKAWHNNRMHNGPAPASLPPAGDAVRYAE